MKNIIIFGGAGFIGTNLIKFLLDRGDKIICVDNLSTGRVSNVIQFKNHKYFYWLNHDITSDECFECLNMMVEDIFYNFVDEIYNLACPASPSKYLKNPITTIHTSVIGTENICKFGMKFNSKILHASTSEVYGDPDNNHHPQNELYRGNVNTIGPRSCYDEGKRLAETILYEYHKLGCRCKIIRIFNTYGPYMDPNDGRVISNFVCQALLNKDMTIYGDGNQTRSFQYIDDLIYGMVEFMKNDEFGPVNLGNPNEFTIKQLAEIIKVLTKSKSNIIYKELPKDDPLQRKADISKAYKMFGYKPKISLLNGLKNTIEYFETELNI